MSQFNSSLRQWCKDNAITAISIAVVDGPTAPVIFAENGKEKFILVISKGLRDEGITAGTPVKTLAEANVFAGKNARGEERLYVGRPTQVSPEDIFG